MLRSACVCVCSPVCCELSLTPNSLSLIGCVILGKDKEGHWREAWGGGNQGNERALPITAWPVASLPYKETLILYPACRPPCNSPLLTLLHSSPHIRHHPLKTKTKTNNFPFFWSCYRIPVFQRVTRKRIWVCLICSSAYHMVMAEWSQGQQTQERGEAQAADIGHSQQSSEIVGFLYQKLCLLLCRVCLSETYWYSEGWLKCKHTHWFSNNYC